MVLDVYDIALNAKGEWDFSDIVPTSVVDFRSSIRADSTVNHDKCVECSAEAWTTASGIFKLTLRDLNTLGEQWKLLVGVDRLHSITKSSEAQIYSLQRQISPHRAELKSVWSEVALLETSLKAGNRQLSTLRRPWSQRNPSIIKAYIYSTLTESGLKILKRYYMNSSIL